MSKRWFVGNDNGGWGGGATTWQGFLISLGAFLLSCGVIYLQYQSKPYFPVALIFSFPYLAFIYAIHFWISIVKGERLWYKWMGKNIDRKTNISLAKFRLFLITVFGILFIFVYIFLDIIGAAFLLMGLVIVIKTVTNSLRR